MQFFRQREKLKKSNIVVVVLWSGTFFKINMTGFREFFFFFFQRQAQNENKHKLETDKTKQCAQKGVGSRKIVYIPIPFKTHYTVNISIYSFSFSKHSYYPLYNTYAKVTTAHLFLLIIMFKEKSEAKCIHKHKIYANICSKCLIEKCSFMSEVIVVSNWDKHV